MIMEVRKKPVNSHSGMTLVELSIAITIIALLAAGIMVGQTMIRHAELQQVATNFLKFRDAIKQFQDKYKYLPGDMPTATTFWDASATCGDPTDEVTSATCNGDGDGKVDEVNDLIYVMTGPSESIYAWQHLVNSKFLEGSYTGQWALGNSIWKPGVNIPKGMDNGGFAFYYATHDTSVLAYSVTDSGYTEAGGTVIGITYPANYNHVISFGKATVEIDTEHPPMGMVFSAADAFEIDAKIDDGKPAYGNVMSTVLDNGGVFQCATAGSPVSAAYKLSLTGKYCTLFFITGF